MTRTRVFPQARGWRIEEGHPRRRDNFGKLEPGCEPADPLILRHVMFCLRNWIANLTNLTSKGSLPSIYIGNYNIFATNTTGTDPSPPYPGEIDWDTYFCGVSFEEWQRKTGGDSASRILKQGFKEGLAVDKVKALAVSKMYG